MTETVRAIDVPFGWIVGPSELQIHLFRPYVVENRARFLDRKTHAFVVGLKEHPEDAAALQEDFREMVDMLNSNYMILCGHDLLGSDYRASRIMETFKQVAATSYVGIPLNFQSFWLSYLHLLVKVATAEEVMAMHAECSGPFWAAMVGEMMGASDKVVGDMVGATAVRTWSLFGCQRSKCNRCRSMKFVCLETGDIEEPRCRLCCIEDLRCSEVEAEAVRLQEYQSLGYTVAGIERLYQQQQPFRLAHFPPYGMRTNAFPPGYIVGTDSLQIHLFIPDVSRERAYAAHGKLQGLVEVVSQKLQNIAALQDDVHIFLNAMKGNYTILCGHEFLGECPPLDVMDGATKEQMVEMHFNCPKPLWVAMVAETMGQSHLLTHTIIGQAAVGDWSIFARVKEVSAVHSSTNVGPASSEAQFVLEGSTNSETSMQI
ncbi:hypothetical protein EV421DRAFT_1737361 [Armillaria borealis]|uniref:Uncharacterized protein n=1 Tax=Armillaria borealis TaxID=47425 RepID=A0AA39JCK8_9AGAR|nr:hypothetical protein EV421DRAFT_1737361 [Armillaria borealis]